MMTSMSRHVAEDESEFHSREYMMQEHRSNSAMRQLDNTFNAHSMEEEAPTLILKFQIVFNYN
jgi:hypothetical protein